MEDEVVAVSVRVCGSPQTCWRYLLFLHPTHSMPTLQQLKLWVSDASRAIAIATYSTGTAEWFLLLYDAVVSVEVLPVADTEFLQHISSLVCYHERANRSVCWSEETVQALCDGLNWYSPSCDLWPLCLTQCLHIAHLWHCLWPLVGVVSLPLDSGSYYWGRTHN